MGCVILRGNCFLEGSGERRGTRVESYQTDQLKTSAARLWTLDSRQLPPQPSTPLALPQPSTLDSRRSTLDARLLPRPSVGRILRRQGRQLRAAPRGIEDPGTVRKRDFKEMPWCNQGAGLRQETASMPGVDWAQWGGEPGGGPPARRVLRLGEAVAR
jgi:hypothetical protein